jgi:hypothetical protein
MRRAKVVLAVLLACAGWPACRAVETARMEQVRSKGVLDAGDLAAIDDFVARAVDEMAGTRDFTSVAKIRTLIVSYSTGNEQSAAVQYAAQFFESARRHIAAALEAAKDIDDADRAFKVTLNLLILVDGLKDLRLLEPAMEFLDGDNAVLRYWAVRCLTNPSVAKKLAVQQAGDSQLVDRITGRFEGLAGTFEPEELALVLQFCAGVNNARTGRLLLKIADIRIGRYAGWTVEYELLDIALLKGLAAAISAEEGEDPGAAVRFAQLYSHAMSRYIKGLAEPVLLSDRQKYRLASVLVEIEDRCIGKLLGIRQSVIKKAVEDGNIGGLAHEHKRLFGDETAAGELSKKLGLTYRGPDGGERLSPLALDEPPGP